MCKKCTIHLQEKIILSRDVKWEDQTWKESSCDNDVHEINDRVIETPSKVAIDEFDIEKDMIEDDDDDESESKKKLKRANKMIVQLQTSYNQPSMLNIVDVNDNQ